MKLKLLIIYYLDENLKYLDSSKNFISSEKKGKKIDIMFLFLPSSFIWGSVDRYDVLTIHDCIVHIRRACLGHTTRVKRFFSIILYFWIFTLVNNPHEGRIEIYFFLNKEDRLFVSSTTAEINVALSHILTTENPSKIILLLLLPTFLQSFL